MCMPLVENEVGARCDDMPLMWNHCLDQLTEFPLKKKKSKICFLVEHGRDIDTQWRFTVVCV